jgi:hypothetical protein
MEVTGEKHLIRLNYKTSYCPFSLQNQLLEHNAIPVTQQSQTLLGSLGNPHCILSVQRYDMKEAAMG